MGRRQLGLQAGARLVDVSWIFVCSSTPAAEPSPWAMRGRRPAALAASCETSSVRCWLASIA
eukprot:2680340-Pyramimonas_sp.AAC.1